MTGNISKVEDALLHTCDVCDEIGRIGEANGHFQAGIHRRITETGKTIEQLTVGELLEINQQYREFYDGLFEPDPTEVN